MMFSFADLRLPIIQAPMAGGPSTVEQAAIVANNGAVGSFGFAYHTSEKVAEDLQKIRPLTNGIINANFFIFRPVSLPTQNEIEIITSDMKSIYPDGFQIPLSPFYPDLTKQLEPIWREKPAILSFHFGIPSSDIVQTAKLLGIAIGMTATSLQEAHAIEKSGADFIIAQGIEAGGHRGIFDVAQHDDRLSTFGLVEQLSASCRLPIVAAGGIMNGDDIKAALQNGATAVQMGTAFLTCKESGASAAHKDYLLHKHDRGTELTYAYSGRPARGIVTDFMAAMRDKKTFPFPIQNILTRTMRQKAIAANDGEHQSLWAGTRYVQCRDETTQELLDRLSKELSLHS